MIISSLQLEEQLNKNNNRNNQLAFVSVVHLQISKDNPQSTVGK